MNALWLITLAHVKENRRALQITWFSGELLEMLFCMMNMWESICSHIPAITRTQHPLSYPGYASSLFVYTSFQKKNILTLLCNSCCSGHVILAQIWLDRSCFCFAKLKRFVGLDEFFFFFKLHFQCANICGLCGSIHRKLLFSSSTSSRLKFIVLFRAQCGKAFRHRLLCSMIQT